MIRFLDGAQADEVRHLYELAQTKMMDLTDMAGRVGEGELPSADGGAVDPGTPEPRVDVALPAVPVEVHLADESGPAATIGTSDLPSRR
jgi:hypothetical protein